MEHVGIEKFIDLLVGRGWLFIAFLCYSIWRISEQESVFGIILSNGDKGFILVQLTLVYIVAHHFVAFCINRSKYYSPSSFRDEVHANADRIRSYVDTIQPSRINNIEEWQELVDRVTSSLIKIPEGYGREELKDVRNWLHKCTSFHYSKSTGVDHSTKEVDSYFENETKLQLCIIEFLKKTEWVKRK